MIMKLNNYIICIFRIYMCVNINLIVYLIIWLRYIYINILDCLCGSVAKASGNRFEPRPEN